MPEIKAPIHLAVIGLGPRGLGALEALAVHALKRDMRINVDVFDPFKWPGAGPNFDPDQSALCILNIPVRALHVNPPDILSDRLASFSEWSARDYQQDEYPPRSELGSYLNARFDVLLDVTKDVFTVTRHDESISGIDTSEAGWTLEADGTHFGPYDEVLLTRGQPETQPDPQLARWETHAHAHDLEILPAYPANALIDAAQDWAGATVAVRGLGLSTFDVLRMLTKGLGGKFVDGSYEPSGNEPGKILPFSLDGLPPAAKPATKAIDAFYDPTEEETRDFEAAMKATLYLDPEGALSEICGALSGPTARILKDLSSTADKTGVERWLNQERNDPGTQDDRDAVEALEADIEMAYGRRAPSIGYVVGQIWRKWQNELRHGVNAHTHDAATAAALVGFDEGLKRFSYGPPVSASQELLVLIKHGLVSLCTVDDPKVLLDPNGWQLIEGDNSMRASVMVDAVLPGPDWEKVTDPLSAECSAKGLAVPIKSGLGAHTNPNGELVAASMTADHGLCMLGRLALGSVIASDSLHDCFGASTHRWADGVIERELT